MLVAIWRIVGIHVARREVLEPDRLRVQRMIAISAMVNDRYR